MERRRERLVDVCVVLGVLALSLPVGSSDDSYPAGVAVSVAAALVLLLRRSQPVGVLATTGVLAVTQLALDLPSTSLAAVLAALWTVADRRERRVALPAAVVVALPIVVMATIAAEDRPDALLLAVSLLSAAWALGAYTRSRRQVVDALRERADRLERERQARAQAAVVEERLRIHREMHDGLGHALTVIAVQADAAGAVLFTDIDSSRAAMAEVADVARGAIAQLRGIVHAGRFPPTPDLTAVADLVAAVRRAGTEVELTVTGALERVLPGPSAAGYRVVQECLTNVQRHAGPAATATVTVTVKDAGLSISVSNAAASAPDRPGTGNGLVAMRERVEAFGGTIEHGWTERSFQVRAEIPSGVGQR